MSRPEARAAVPAEVAAYLGRRAWPGPWRLEGAAGNDFAGTVVIPALAEEASLPQTLASLADNPREWLRRFLIVVVVNQRADATAAAKDENRRTLQLLAARGRSWSPLNLAWVDAASPGRELPAGEGVGLARKLGCDLALDRLDWQGSAAPVMALLDADTLVAPDYLPALGAHFRKAAEGGAVIPFRHQTGANPALEEAIGRYEGYLFGYALGLALARSPYAFPTVGSAVACRARAYVRAGGMNRRLAGEDFYFLQQVAKTSGVAWLQGTMVRPAARLSCRVPFGTGPSLASQLEHGPEAVRCPPAAAFRVLAAWLEQTAAADPEITGQGLLDRGREIAPHLAQFLATRGFPAIWERLRRNHRTSSGLNQAFHCWFDALKTRQLLHLLTTGPFPPTSPRQALDGLLAWAGERQEEPGSPVLMLRQLIDTGRIPMPSLRFFSAPTGGKHPGGLHESGQIATAGQR